MRRILPRRPGRGRAPTSPSATSWPGLAAAFDVPPHCPDDIVALLHTASAEAPRLIAGCDPAEVGLLLIHPDSPACPPDLARRDRVALRVEPLAELRALAAELHALLEPRPGWFAALLIGADRAATVHIAPASVAAREAS